MATERAERSYQILGESISEIERLVLQHRWVQKCIDDRIVFAPVDLRKPDLKVLDVGCSNGMYSTPAATHG
jgi:2-polyprenyl-3-methyl-5-hydroxy-6-metoxy-1,4-benzoquinol methylase